MIRVVNAHAEETVEIQWTCRDGSVFVQSVTIPPKDVRDARMAEPDYHQPVRDTSARMRHYKTVPGTVPRAVFI